MGKVGYIYQIKNKTTCTVYIGLTKQNPGARWFSHISDLRSGKHGNPSLQSAWSESGITDFTFEVTCVVAAEGKGALDAALHEAEMLAIAGAPNHYNRLVPTDEAGRKFTHSAASRKSLSEAYKRLPQEVKDRLKMAGLGHVPSEYARQRTREVHTGCKRSTETKQKMSDVRKGRLFGPAKWTPEQLAKRTETRRANFEAKKAREAQGG